MEAACRQAERSVREPLLQRISGLEGALVEVRRSETPCRPADSRGARLSVRMLTRGRVCRCVSLCVGVWADQRDAQVFRLVQAAGVAAGMHGDDKRRHAAEVSVMRACVLQSCSGVYRFLCRVDAVLTTPAHSRHVVGGAGGCRCWLPKSGTSNNEKPR